MRLGCTVVAIVLCCFGAQAASAVPTEIVVRVMAKDAKFIGTETGGMQITLKDADSGKVLAEGLTIGETGSTPKIMMQGHARRDPLSDAKSAKFATTLDLAKPVRITATATGPMMLKDSAMTVSSTQWVIPGKSVNGGDGWVLELPGFAISMIEPLPESVPLKDGAAKIPVKAKITMQCGCPITAGGLWDANKLEVAALLERGDKVYPATPLQYASQANTFGGDITVAEPGAYTVDLYAYDPSNGNTGLAKFKIDAR